MARQSWTGRIDPTVLGLVRKRAELLVRSEAFIIEMALGELFKNELPPGWRAGAKNETGSDKPEGGRG